MALSVDSTPIPGLLVVHLEVHHDTRGWFKENWQRAKLQALGLPDLGPVQQNISFNEHRGSTRGLHAEPWDKYVSVAGGRVFAAWVDLREGDTFGTTFHCELDDDTAVYVPRGIGNSYQTLDDAVAYAYLVNEHWRPGIAYPAVALDDPTIAIPWPIPLAESKISEKDQHNPALAEVTPIPRRVLVLGAAGQLGRALVRSFPGAVGVDLDDLDLTDADALAAWPWRDSDVVLNAAAFTDVDGAETPEGRRAAWAVNATLPSRLARLADEHRFTLVHYSTDYVFDGTREQHDEAEPLSPVSVYGQSKAAGDLAVSTVLRHYVLRTSWLIGEGGNFVRTMARLAVDGVSPTVVDDQTGRLTFADELARATRHLLDVGAASGTYHVSNGGDPMSWAQVAERVFAVLGREAGAVVPVSTDAYVAAGGGRQVAPRPRSSVFDLTKLRATGFEPQDAEESLRSYLAD